MYLTETAIRATLKPHRRGSDAISLLYATGEITDHTVGDLLNAVSALELAAQHEKADALLDIREYVLDVGARPAVPGWPRS